MITISDEVRNRVNAQYTDLCTQAGTHKASTVLTLLSSRLPFPVEIEERPAHKIHQCAVTGQARTDEQAGKHHITLASQLTGSARTHTLAHELYHLAFHRLDEANLDKALDYYLSFDEFADIPRSLARIVLLDALNTPFHRNGEATVWEQEAECFATLVVANSSLITRPSPRSALFTALGEFRRVP